MAETVVTPSQIDKLVVALTRETDYFKAEVLLRLEGERYGYQAAWKVPTTITSDADILSAMFDAMEGTLLGVFDGKVSLKYGV